jgi:hypothetical protein
LVFSPSTKSWHSPSACIWAKDQIQLPGKVSIATQYKSHEAFFLKILQVPQPNLLMHIEELKQKASQAPNKQSIMQAMMNISGFDPNPESLRSLSTCKCFPVTLPAGGGQVWVNQRKDFSIIDKVEYAQMFGGKISMLDLSLEEVHFVKPFLVAMGLSPQFLSNAVQERTTVRDGALDSTLTADLRKKSYAICR